MPSKLLLKKEDHDKIQQLIELKGDENYSVITQRVHGTWRRSIHVFTRLPKTSELTDFENTSSKVKFRGGGKAEVQSGAVLASVKLYNILIDRVYDLPIGNRIYGEVTMDEAGNRTGEPLRGAELREKVPALVKREALRDFIAEVYSESRLAERETDDDEDEVKKDDEDED